MEFDYQTERCAECDGHWRHYEPCSWLHRCCECGERAQFKLGDTDEWGCYPCANNAGGADERPGDMDQ